MNISQFVEATRDVLHDPNSRTYLDEVIVRHCDQQVRRMSRVQAESNKEYQSFSLGVRASAARRLFRDVWEYRLPSWIYAVTRAWRFVPGAAADTDPSPYVWASDQTTLREEVTKSERGRAVRWTWEGLHTLRLWNTAVAYDLIFKATKTPPRMFRALIATAHASALRMYLPPNLQLGSMDLDLGSYINAEVEITGTFSPTSTNFAQSRRIVASNANVIVSSTRQYELVFEAALPAVLAVADTVETRIPIEDEHARLLVLSVANACFDQNANLPGKRAIADELRAEWGNFHAYATTPRDESGPTFYAKFPGLTRRYDPDRYPNYRYI